MKRMERKGLYCKCGNPVIAKGLCNSCYQIMRKIKLGTYRPRPAERKPERGESWRKLRLESERRNLQAAYQLAANLNARIRLRRNITEIDALLFSDETEGNHAALGTR